MHTTVLNNQVSVGSRRFVGLVQASFGVLCCEPGSGSILAVMRCKDKSDKAVSSKEQEKEQYGHAALAVSV
jgi:hypothetical protein